MSIKRAIRNLIERASGSYILDSLPPGVDFFYDLPQFLPSFSPRVVFDVGANAGQSAMQFIEKFPGAQLYCFEPVKSTYNSLVSNLACVSNVECFPVAMSAAPGSGTVLVEEESVLSRLVDGRDVPSRSFGATLEDVEVDSIGEFCRRRHIERIGFLKIDTEGHDLEVLHGARGLLESMAIDLIQVEAGMNRNNELHVPIQSFMEFLEPLGYFLFKIYEQVHEQHLKSPVLRRSNPVFLSSTLVEESRRAGNGVSAQALNLPVPT